MNFKTQAEIFQALLDGKKIRQKTYRGGTYIMMGSTNLVSESLTEVSESFNEPRNWSIYEEPKPKKQVWQWRHKHPGIANWELYHCLVTEEQARSMFHNELYEKHAGPFEVEDN